MVICPGGVWASLSRVFRLSLQFLFAQKSAQNLRDIVARVLGGSLAKLVRTNRQVLKVSSVGSLAVSICALSTSTALADVATMVNSISTSLSSNNLAMFAIFTGAFSFAMMSASWLIRERRRLEREYQALGLEHADLKARHEHAEALLDVPDQRVVIWRSFDDTPICRGALPASVQTPPDAVAFTAFGSWMKPDSATSFEQAVGRLRQRAEGFDLTVETRNGSMIDVQGRASGSHAFVRFISLSGDRAALAGLEAEHTQLLNTTDTMKALLEAIPMPVWLHGVSDRITWANTAYVEAVDGESIDQVCAENLHLLDAASRDGISKTHREEADGSDVNHFHQRLPVTISGDRRMMDVSDVTYAGGSAGMAVDMGEVEEVQSRLRRTIESHTQTMNQLATAVAIFDSKRRLIFHNQAFQSLWQFKASDLDGEPDNGALFDLLRAEGRLAEQPDWSKWRNNLLSVYGDTEPKEDWWHLPDGRTLRIVANPHPQGGMTWVFENITEKLEMESRYIALTQVQGETLDHLNEAIAVFGSDGRLKLSNPSFQKLWTLPDEGVAAETPLATISAQCAPKEIGTDNWERLVTSVTGVLDARKEIMGRMNIKSGETLDYAMVPLPNGQNMISFVDVTARVKMEHALTERNEALEAAERLKNAFIEHVSYEFRAPLTSIIGFAEMLGSETFGPLNEKQREYVDHVSSSSGVLHSMVDNMLDLATVDAGIMQLDLISVDLKTAVSGALQAVAEQLKEQGVKLHLKLPPQQENFVADVTRVQQVLYNLLSNAISFSPEGGSIELSCESTSQAVVLRVSDEGPGIPEEKQDAIFKRFESRSHEGSGRGVGLGLAIARSLVELHGGKLILDTSVEKGASFVCQFPKEPEHQAQAAE